MIERLRQSYRKQEQGDSKRAFSEAHQALLASVDSGRANPDAARQVVVAGLTEVQKSKKTEEITLSILLQTILNHYPISSDSDKAKVRAQAWHGVYGEQISQFHALADLIKVYQVLEIITKNREFQSLLIGVLGTIDQLAASPEYSNEKGIRIIRIKEGTAQQSQEAFEAYQEKFGIHSPEFAITEYLNLAGYVIGKKAGDTSVLERLKLYAQQVKASFAAGRARSGLKTTLISIVREARHLFPGRKREKIEANLNSKAEALHAATQAEQQQLLHNSRYFAWTSRDGQPHAKNLLHD